MLLEPKSGCVYGPVRSRRLGRSLGINPLPAGRKTCTLDCQYCQYGWTPPTPAPASAFPPPADVLRAVEERLGTLEEPPDYLTFSGNGEPTLHPRFPDLVDGVLGIRDRLAPRARVAILSNSTTAGDPEVRDALRRLDVRIMKLDAGRGETLRRFNQPRVGISVEDLVESLRALGGVTVQALFAGGRMGNAVEEDVEPWLEVVRRVRPVTVQVYSLDRDTPSRELLRLDAAALRAIADRLSERGIEARAF